MKYILFFLIFISSFCSLAQSAADAAVQINASISGNPPQIVLSWPSAANTNSYQVFRKLKTASAWGNLVASFSGSINQYTDNNVSINTNYEYKVVRIGSNYTGYGYINAGIDIPEISNRGTLLLLVDSTFNSSLSSEISRLINDMEGDGWDVVQKDLHRNASVYHVKDEILSVYHADSLNLKAIFILGHVPVPYSGNINPDGHPDHLGAWPADCYYADIDGNWTDAFVTSTTASPARTQNVPGDGKFDQSSIPSDLELQVGRVDFSNMPAFAQSELQLLKNYLDKDHEYRKKIVQAQKRGIIDDNFGYFSSEAFAANAYKNFAALVGNTNISSADYITGMSSGSYLWSYGCGNGSFTSASGIGATSNFTNTNLQGVFSMLFGSYFGDWDSQNNFLRAPLAQGKILTNVWSGRPHYKFHHMALGENIGYGLLLTQNNLGLYFDSPTGITGRWVHNSLMGDPTLRNDVVAPVSNVVATRVGSDCYINWSASTETAMVGYNIYMKNDSQHVYTKINSSPITANSYTHHCLLYPGTYKYLVRTLKLEQTPSGSYYNMSEGLSDTAYNTNNIAGIAAFTHSIIGNKAIFTNASNYPASYQWDFGNGTSSSISNPTVAYTANGFYFVQLIASNACYLDTSSTLINILEVGIEKNNKQNTITAYPNPNHGMIQLKTQSTTLFDIKVYDLTGKEVIELKNLKSDSTISLSKLSKGNYILEAEIDKQKHRSVILIE